jgi:hypothetical protein
MVAVNVPQNIIHRSNARIGINKAMTPSEISILPTRGIIPKPVALSIPKRLKYGIQLSLVIIPKAPCPINSAATAILKIQ